MVERSEVAPLRACTGCKVPQPAESFYKSCARCRSCHNANYRAWRLRNLEKARKSNRDCQTRRHAADPERVRKIKRDYMKNPLRRIGTQVYKILRQAKGGRSCQELVGYTEAELRAHLERQFLKGMSWANFGEWHIDHIVPLSSFTITGPDDPEIKRAWGLPNLRPLWAIDNIRKGAKRETLL